MNFNSSPVRVTSVIKLQPVLPQICDCHNSPAPSSGILVMQSCVAYINYYSDKVMAQQTPSILKLHVYEPMQIKHLQLYKF